MRLHIVLVLAVLAAPATRAQTASFRGLGDFPGGFFGSAAGGVSADGTVVVGSSVSFDEAFRWTAGSGMVRLGDLPGGVFSSRAFGVSADGSVVVGGSQSSRGDEAFRWTAGGMVGLGDLPGGVFQSASRGVSADGTVVVGQGVSANGNEAFRWTTGPVVGLGDLPGGSFRSFANSASADGTVVVGEGTSASGREAFRWTAGGMVGLGDLPGGNFSSVAFGVSADGSVVVGGSQSSRGDEAFRWTAGGGMVGLGGLPGLPGDSFSSQARGVSADGAVVVGGSTSANASEGAFIWTEASGMKRLRAALAVALGPDSTALAGWGLREAIGVSADGSVIVGNGTNPQGRGEAWRAVLGRGPVAGGDAPGAPEALGLAVAPNPMRGAAAVRLALPVAGPVRVSVVDLLGREVAVLTDGERSAGTHTLPLDAARLAPGVYAVRLATPAGLLVRRLTVAR